jgi:tetratricopeptide (TPR) repeat protein
LPQRGGPAGSGRFEVGANLVQESCRAEAAPLDEQLVAAGLSARQYDIYCGEWERPSARVRVLGDSGDTAASAATQGPWAESLDELAACEPPTATAIFAATAATALDCRLRAGGWPYSALAADVDGKTYLGDGIPSALPALERAIAVLAGHAEATAGEPSQAVQRIQQNLSGRLFGTGDLDTYQSLMRAGSYYNGIRSFAEAEAAYRQALEIHERVLGTTDPAYGEPLMHLAPEVSNQERFSVPTSCSPRPRRWSTPRPNRRTALACSAIGRSTPPTSGTMRRRRSGPPATALRRQIAGQAAGLNDTGSQAQYYGAAIANLSSSAPVLQTSSSVAALDTAQSLSAEAAMLLKLGRAEEASRTIDEALALVDASAGSPEFWRPQLLLRSAEVDVALGDLNSAEQSVRFALAQLEQLRPGTRPAALAWLQLGTILAKQERGDEAIEAYDKGLAFASATTACGRKRSRTI